MNVLRLLPLLSLIVFCGKVPEVQPLLHHQKEGMSWSMRLDEGDASRRIQLHLPDFTEAIDFIFDDEARLVLMDGHDQSFSERDRIALSQGRMRIEEGTDRFGTLLSRIAAYLETSPADHPLGSLDFSGGQEHILCLRKGDRVTAEWNTRDQTVLHEEILVGESRPQNYGCMGRCGIDCGWGAASAWTQDCLDHDACSYQQKAKNQRRDLDCGDEFDQAADDWIMGVLVGCDGRAAGRPQKNFL